MLARTPLAAEIAALERALTNAEPPYVKKAREALIATREKRANVAQRYEAECLAAREGKAMRPTPAMLALEKELEEINQKIEVQRFELLQARADWWPSFRKSMVQHVNAVVPTLERTVEDIQAAATFFSVYDDFVRDHALVAIAGSQQTRLSNRLYTLADDIRRFLSARGEKQL